MLRTHPKGQARFPHSRIRNRWRTRFRSKSQPDELRAPNARDQERVWQAGLGRRSQRLYLQAVPHRADGSATKCSASFMGHWAPVLNTLHLAVFPSAPVAVP